MKLTKRDCGIKMELIPYGAGWTDVNLDICGDHHYFIISYCMGDLFDALLDTLYYLYPENHDSEGHAPNMEYKYAIQEYIDAEYRTKAIVDETHVGDTYHHVPWKAAFEWDEEGFSSQWAFERDPTEETEFTLRIDIIHGGKYHYEVDFSDFCYAVAKACTEAMKKHGFCGYRRATYNQDFNVRQLLLLKSIALKNFEAVELTYYDEKGKGETSDFSKEIELLLFDM